MDIRKNLEQLIIKYKELAVELLKRSNELGKKGIHDLSMHRYVAYEFTISTISDLENRWVRRVWLHGRLFIYTNLQIMQSAF